MLVASAVLIGTIVHWPILRSGYWLDDHLQNAMLDGSYPVHRTPLDLFSFARPGPEIQQLVQGGALPWWSHPDLRLSAFRPVSSLTIAFDHALGLSPAARHVHSELWWIALIAAFSLLARELLPRAMAASAVVIFALDPARIIPIGWLANRAALICSVFGILALYAHLRWREHGLRFGAVVSGFGWLLALLAGEYGLCAFAYVMSYELFARSEPFTRRLRALLPAAVVAAGCAVAYLALGFGSSANGLYLSPLAAPGEFLLQGSLRFPSLLANELFAIPVDFVTLALAVRYSAIVVLMLPLLVFGWLVSGVVAAGDARTARMLRFCCAALPLSILPLIATLASTRLLLIPSVSGSLLVGAVLWDAWTRLRGSREPIESWRGTGPMRILAAGCLGAVHLLFVPWFTVGEARAMVDQRDAYRTLCLNAPIDDANAARQDHFVINTLDGLQSFYTPYVRQEHGSPKPRTWHTLAMSLQPVNVRRTAPETLELSAWPGSLLDNPQVHGLRRFDLPLLPGDVVALDRLRIEVVDVGPTGPMRLRCHFGRRLEDPSLNLMVMTDAGFARFVPPAVGAETIVSHPRLPLPGPL